MPVFPILLLLFFTIPLIEIFVLIKVGGIIGVWATVGLVILTAVIGAYLLKQQGIATLTRVQRTMDQGQLPARELVEGFFLVIGGALLLTPGFFTDAIGFACLIPLTRQLLAAWMIRRGVFAAHTHVRAQYQAQGRQPPGQEQRGRTIEGEWEREEPVRPEVEPPEHKRGQE
ncbi:FxsA family protein [Ectothiorhodospira lacustris]|uniref:FxsA family protein n=1 Tax=Ectothiorhodospira lacustris TaxID=2899127 RepID=UPI001EE85F53|nr:FxsA family protein [Ectothiorhodospira lacustris]MCG5501514.1 membrane protein FxsA [Ectothiorhodospira lacustris]